MCFIFNMYVFIVPLDRFRCQTLIKFAFRSFSSVGDVVSFRHALYHFCSIKTPKQLFVRVLIYSELNGDLVSDTNNKLFSRNGLKHLKNYRYRKNLTLDLSPLGQNIDLVQNTLPIVSTQVLIARNLLVFSITYTTLSLETTNGNLPPPRSPWAVENGEVAVAH